MVRRRGQHWYRMDCPRGRAWLGQSSWTDEAGLGLVRQRGVLDWIGKERRRGLALSGLAWRVWPVLVWSGASCVNLNEHLSQCQISKFLPDTV